MATATNIENMDMMHFMCQREVQQLQRNLTRYLLESARMRHFISSYSTDNSENGHMTGYTLMAYDSYMSNMEMIVDMARKFNIHLQLKKLSKAVTNCCEAPQQRSFQDYLHWNIYREQHAKEYELKLKAVDNVMGQQKTVKSLERNAVPPAEPIPTAETSLVVENSPACTNNVLRKVRFTESPHPNIASLKLKDLSEFIEDYEFSATISYVEDYEQLVFFICQLNNTELLELSIMFNLRKLQAPPNNTNEVFGISIHSDRILRAVIHLSSPGSFPATKALLIDFGEVVTLDDSCVLYEMPLKYRNIPVQAIKCVLLGVNVEQQNCDRHHLGNVLRQSEFKRCMFRVVRSVGRVLHVLFLVNDADAIHNKKFDTCPAGSERVGQLNPFLFSSEDEDDLKNFEEDLSQVAVPLAALPKNNASLKKESVSNELRAKVLPMNDTVSSTTESAEDEDIKTSIMKKKSRMNLTDESYQIITATFVVDIESFYAQIEEDPLEPMEPLTWTDREVPETERLKQAPQLRDLILAKYNKDGIWYRAIVVEIDEKNSLFKVFYVDYGNNEIVPINCLAKCFCDEIKAPYRAVRCRLADICSITTNDEIRQQQAIDIICLIILNQTFAVRVLEKNEKEQIIRIIDEDYAEVTKSLVRLGYAKEIESHIDAAVV